MSKSVQKIYKADLTKHPATQAWLKLHPQMSLPLRIVELKPTHRKSAVYRLDGAGPEKSAVIAKRCLNKTAMIERKIYEQILPNVPVSTLKYYGTLEELYSDYSWIFLEDAGDIWYSNSNAEHRTLAAKWLGSMHTSTSQMVSNDFLPDKGAMYYLNVLRSTRKTIERNLSNPALQADDIVLLNAIVDQLDGIESNWDKVDKFCETIPKTLVHGDFVGKNVRIRHCQNGNALFPFDWESAGYGVPAPDLESLDIIAYQTTVAKSWLSLDIKKAQRLAKIGRIYRVLMLISWASENLSYPWVEKTIQNYMSFYHSWLSKSIRAIG